MTHNGFPFVGMETPFHPLTKRLGKFLGPSMGGSLEQQSIVGFVGSTGPVGRRCPAIYLIPSIFCFQLLWHDPAKSYHLLSPAIICQDWHTVRRNHGAPDAEKILRRIRVPLHKCCKRRILWAGCLPPVGPTASNSSRPTICAHREEELLSPKRALMPASGPACGG